MSQKKGRTYHVYDRTTCTETEIPDNLYAIVDVQNTLFRVHCKTGDAEEIVSSPSAYLVSDNGLYLYTYRTLENEIYCYNVKTGDYFTVSVDNEFTDYIRSISEDYNVYYQMSLSKSMDQLLITYYSNKKPTAPVIPEMTEEQKLREEKAERRSKSIKVMREALRKKNNIIDYLDYIIANGYKEEYDLHAYTGDGYIVVYVGVQNYMAVVDDYRNHTFKIYADTPTGDHAFVSLYKPAPNTIKEAACKNTYDETLKKIKVLGIPVSTGAFDYSIFNTNDKFDAAKARDYKFSKSFVAAHGRDVDLFKRVCEAKKSVHGISGDSTAVGNFAIGSAHFVLVTNGSNYYMRDSYGEEIYEIPKAIFDELLAAPWCRHIAPDDYWIIWD